MVNKKLSVEDEEAIYMEWLAGTPLTKIAENYPVVISTVQRVIKKRSLTDDSRKNFMISSVFKHLKHANQPLETAMKLFVDNKDEIHHKQKEFLMQSLKKLSDRIDQLIDAIESLS
ncbi:hypothetical protein AV955_gp045 [Diadromus pulchellus ascovirus 4a]|uniref:Complete DpAV4 genome n=1 Tax=Diadromus pulchellus ascovirus 4a TaxID=158683 RepID=F2NYX4_9VIRU|nr:hypothetical protein AV955_gp045 [Diadromus pulchellus ascovirus 4a]CCA61402.1 unnamed protein product [Diadromus pulchellus ascovirus 4a]